MITNAAGVFRVFCGYRSWSPISLEVTIQKLGKHRRVYTVGFVRCDALFVLFLVLSEAVLVLVLVLALEAILYSPRFQQPSSTSTASLSTSTTKSDAKCDAMHEPLLSIEIGFADLGFHADGFG
jgi:hypothetical protein